MGARIPMLQNSMAVSMTWSEDIHWETAEAPWPPQTTANMVTLDFQVDGPYIYAGW